MSQPCDLTMTRAIAEMRAKRLSSAELTRSTLDRLAASEGRLHAYVVVLEAEAMAAAKAADAKVARGDRLGPLHGVPIAVKDIFDLAGQPTRCGSRVREDAPAATADAESVALARAAGAVFIGKTVTQEFAAGVISPPARNPWNPERIPGGSSGGSGAAVAAGSAMAAFGSDTGGSIRNPAAINGIVGLKPTFGAVDRRGVFPLSWSLDTVGPLARTVEDAARFLDVIAASGPGRSGPAAAAPDAARELRDGIIGLRIGVSRTFFADHLQPDVERAFEAALGQLRDLGAEVVDADWADASAARTVSFVVNRVECAAVHEGGLRRHPELYGDELRLRLESNTLYPAEGYLRALRARTLVKRSIAALFATHRLDALVTPTSPAVAAPADDLTVVYADGFRETVNLAYTRFTMPFNATGQPALAVACGFDGQGLPIGMQIVGRPFAEARICRIGHAYEEAAGWSRRRPPLAAS